MRAALLACICFTGAGCIFGGGRHDDDVDAAGNGVGDAGVGSDALCRDGDIRDGGITFSLTGRVVQFETAGEPATAAAVELHTAWDFRDIFPVGCLPLARAVVGSAESFVARFVSVKGPTAFVIAMYVDGEGQVHSINDKRLPAFPCNGCVIGSEASPYPLWVLSRATFDAWRPSIPIDSAKSGLVVITFRDGDGMPVPGVTVQGQMGLNQFHDLEPGKEVFFLAADRRTIESRTTTGASGTAIIPLPAGTEMDLQGKATGIMFETGITVATVAGSVFFEQMDPR